MTDLEQLVREDLTAAADGYTLDPDPDAVLAAGRRARRTRSTRVMLVGILAVALSAFSALVAPPIIAQVLNRQTVEFASTVRWNDTAGEFSAVSVRLDRDNGTVRLTAEGPRTGTPSVTSTWDLPDTGVSRFTLGSRTVVAVFPGEVGGLSLGGPDSLIQSDWAAAFERTVAVGALRHAVADPAGLDWLWLDASNTLRNSDGSAVPGAWVSLGGTDRLLYRDDSAGMLGIWDVYSFSLKDNSDTNLLDGCVVEGAGSAQASWQLGMLPTGAHDVQLTLSSPKGSWAQTTLADGSVLVAATIPGDVDRVVSALSYLTADGTRVSHH